MLEIVEELGPVLAGYHLCVGHLLELLEERPGVFYRVEEEDKRLGLRHGSESQV